MNEEKEYNVITLENGIEYTEIDRINFNNNCYVVLSNLENLLDGYKDAFENREEFNNVLKLFNDKYNS